MRIAILGCGYVGSELAFQLKNAGHTITVTTRSHEKLKSLKNFSDEACLLRGSDCDSLKRILKTQDAVVITLAADSAGTYDDTYQGTAQALSQIIDCCLPLKHIIYTSSTSVYGDHFGNTVTEETDPLAKQETSQILLTAEKILLNLALHDRQVCILRLGEIYGPGREIAHRLRRLDGASLPGDGSSITNLSFLEDIVKAIVFALEKNLDGIFNVCGDLHIPRKDFYEQICLQEKISTVSWDASKQSIHSGNKLVSNQKIKSAGFMFSPALPSLALK